MKKKFIFLLLTVFALTLFATGCGSQPAQQEKAGEQQNQATEPTSEQSNTDPSLEEIKAKGKLVLGLDDAFPPMGFRDEKGEIIGFDIDMAKEAAKRLGVELELKPVNWDGIVMSLKNKDIDVVWNGMTITEERKKQIAFSKPYIANRQIIIVTSKSTIKAKADLADKVLGLQGGSSSETALAADKATESSLKEVKKYGTYPEALMDLKAGRSDAVLIDEVVGRYYIAKQPGEYTVLTDDFGREEYGVGIRQEDVSFREALDKALDDMKADGTADEIAKKWFGEPIILK